MKVIETHISGPLILEPQRFGDHRGFFSETYNKDRFTAAGIDLSWVQDNHSRSAKKGVVRGLHWQNPPQPQAKLVRVTRGAIYDVIVDIRVSSPTFGQHIGVELSEENWRQLYVPVGFAHGFCTLSDDCEVLYKASGLYAPEHEQGLLWNDPELAICWPVDDLDATLSERDTKWQPFHSLKSEF
jgi:dTDP-4-dehydrorhamnose 3,5-epimerase